MTLRTAVVGGGAVSDIHLSGVAKNPRTELVAICDVDEVTAREKALEYGILPYTDLDDLLASEDLDWLHLCTPVATHLPLAETIIEAGVPILIEKPVTDTAAEAEQLRALARQHGVPVAVVRNHRFTSAMREATAAVEAGDLGEVRAVEVTYTGNTWPDEVNRGSWTFDLPGGEFEEGIPHPIYLALGAGGFPVDEASVQAVTSRHGAYEQGFSYDGLSIQYPTAEETLCGVTVLAGAVPQRTVDIHGTDASLVVDQVSGTVVRLNRDYKASPLARLRNDLDRAAGRLRGTVENVRDAVTARRHDDWDHQRLRNPHYYQFDREAARLLAGEDPLVPLDDGVWTLRLMEAVREAAGRERTDQAADADVRTAEGTAEATIPEPPDN
ncbi:Gfo/Idh/MocA family protein [Haloglomus litoreum]|uniref:Gfo/Idh/MocA family protein n=1 Tax=Haloglomus litoreum TaxID=3034026 RepID=UPI0023E7F72A|nr:Gfo/Idh/MocA family oxidoreductase [Haloglomus sp. DT116]